MSEDWHDQEWQDPQQVWLQQDVGAENQQWQDRGHKLQRDLQTAWQARAQQQHKQEARQHNQGRQATAPGGSTSSTSSAVLSMADSRSPVAAKPTTGSPKAITAPEATGVLAPTSGSKGDAMVVDLPWSFHWPKLIPWLLLEGCELGLTFTLLQDASDQGSCSLDPDCTPQFCVGSPARTGFIVASLLLGAVWLAIFAAFVFRARALLRRRPWQLWPMANAGYRMQARLGMWVFIMILLAMVLLYVVPFNSCAHYSFFYYGSVPTELVWAAVTLIGCLLFAPVNSQLCKPLLVKALQEFAWTEDSLQRRLQERNEAAHGLLDTEPMFCCETAVKLFYWSCLSYQYQQEASTGNTGVASSPKGKLDQLSRGLRMYRLTSHEAIDIEQTRIRALFAWSGNTIVIAFRGSAAAVNFMADAMVWQAIHPPSRGTWYDRPRVHTGFLRCWTEGGLDRRVLGMAAGLIGGCNLPRLKIYVTGHSLGGALATLAAYDIAKAHPELQPHQVSCYTFGCPRTGNRAFAADYEAAVPDTWHVINDQDAVARGGKFVAAYKRNGQRVIINTFGHLIVRPVPLVLSLLQVPYGSSVSHHLLAAYRRALAAVAAAQYDVAKALPGGAEGVAELVRMCPLVVQGLYQYHETAPVMWLGNKLWCMLTGCGPARARQCAAMQPVLPLFHGTALEAEQKLCAQLEPEQQQGTQLEAEQQLHTQLEAEQRVQSQLAAEEQVQSQLEAEQQLQWQQHQEDAQQLNRQQQAKQQLLLDRATSGSGSNEKCMHQHSSDAKAYDVLARPLT